MKMRLSDTNREHYLANTNFFQKHYSNLATKNCGEAAYEPIRKDWEICLVPLSMTASGLNPPCTENSFSRGILIIQNSCCSSWEKQLLILK